MKKVLLTIGEFTNKQGEVKKNKVKVGRVHDYQDGGESIVLTPALPLLSISADGEEVMAKREMKVEINTKLLEQLLEEFQKAMDRKDMLIRDLDKRVTELEGKAR